MSTRSLTIVKDQNRELIVMYRQSDGYPSGHGKDLAIFLKNIKLIDGLSYDQKKKTANGVECLAAQIVASFKKNIGGIYLYPEKQRDLGEEYIYEIEEDYKSDIVMTVYSVYRRKSTQIFKGNSNEYLEWLTTQEN